jgi:hypothetical protein
MQKNMIFPPAAASLQNLSLAYELSKPGYGAVLVYSESKRNIGADRFRVRDRMKQQGKMYTIT